MQPLKPLHVESLLSPVKLSLFGKWSTQQLIDSLKLGQKDSLKARPDGTILDGHQRIEILRNRGVNVDLLPREVVPKN